MPYFQTIEARRIDPTSWEDIFIVITDGEIPHFQHFRCREHGYETLDVLCTSKGVEIKATRV